MFSLSGCCPPPPNHPLGPSLSGSSLPGVAASAGPAGQQGGGGEGLPVGADPGQSRLRQRHLQREVMDEGLSLREDLRV